MLIAYVVTTLTRAADLRWLGVTVMAIMVSCMDVVW